MPTAISFSIRVNIIKSIGIILIAFVLTLSQTGNLLKNPPAVMPRRYFVVTFVVVFGGCLSFVVAKFTTLDLDAIGNLTENTNTKCVVFVEDSQDVSLLNSIKVLSGRLVYHSVVNTSFLGDVGGSEEEFNFFERRTAIVTRGQLKLSMLLGKVSAPHFVTWIVFKDHTSFPELYIPVSSQVIFVNSTPGSISAMRMYHLKPETEAMVKPFSLERSTDAPLEKINFHNVTMNMLILYREEQYLNVAMTLTKIEWVQQELLQSVAFRLNFSINIVECLEKDYAFGYPNGSEGELFLKLKNREVDFTSVAFVVLRRKNKEYMDFVWPTFLLKSRMYLKQGKLAGRWLTYVRPLESSVWLGILLLILITGALIQISEKFLRREFRFNFSFVHDLITSILKSLQVFCNQAVSDIPASYSIRIIYFLTFFVFLIFFQAYCGYLVSSITVVVSHFPFTDLKGFFENQQYRIMTLRRGFHHFYVKKVIGEGQKEGFMLPQDDLPHTVQQAVDRLCIQKYVAFIEFREDLLNYERLNCKIAELPTPTDYLYIGIPITKKMPLKEFLRRELLHLKSTGIVRRLGSRLSSHSDFRDKNSHNEFISVSMTQIFSVFVFLGLGAVLSILILTVELIVDRCKSPRNAGKTLKKYRGNIRYC